MRFVTVLASVAAVVNFWSPPTEAAQDAQQSTAVARLPEARRPVPQADPLALQMRNDEARGLYLLGKSQCAHARYAEGVKALNRAHGLERLPDLLFEMAACHGRAGAMQQAFALHRRYVDSFRDPVQRLVAAARFGAIMQQVREAAKNKNPPMPKAP